MAILKNAFNGFARSALSAYIKAYRKQKSEVLWHEMQVRATKATADFVEAEMGAAVFCQTRRDLFEAVRAQVGPGQIVEFGVFEGKTINEIAALFPDREIFGFDSFHGLPSDWVGNRYSKVNFDRKGALPPVASNVRLVRGWFDESLPPFFAEHKDPLALVHVDCDIYASTVSVFRNTAPLMRAGTIVIFDEFFNYPGFRQHEFRAWFEFVEQQAIAFEYLAYSGEQVAVKITSIRA